MRTDKNENKKRNVSEGEPMEIYQQTYVIFNDPCMRRERPQPDSPLPNTDPLT